MGSQQLLKIVGTHVSGVPIECLAGTRAASRGRPHHLPSQSDRECRPPLSWPTSPRPSPPIAQRAHSLRPPAVTTPSRTFPTPRPPRAPPLPPPHPPAWRSPRSIDDGSARHIYPQAGTPWFQHSIPLVAQTITQTCNNTSGQPRGFPSRRTACCRTSRCRTASEITGPRRRHLSAFGGVDGVSPFQRAVVQSPAMKPAVTAARYEALYAEFQEAAGVGEYVEARGCRRRS